MKRLNSYSLFIIILILLSCNNSSRGDKAQDKQVKTYQEKVKDDKELIEKGMSFAMQTQRVLASNLINAINTKGTLHALTFCADKAYSLTDSMSNELEAKIKRVSDNPRNPGNEAGKQEAAYILKSKELLAKGEEIKPKLTEINGKMVGYYPIITNQICMQCHGIQGTDVLPEILTQIENLYPDDQGIGYKINELRGIWVVEMDKE